MKVKIEIDCDTHDQLKNHLVVIQEQIGALQTTEIEEHNVSFSDSNCYGDHEVSIRNGRGTYCELKYEELVHYKESATDNSIS